MTHFRSFPFTAIIGQELMKLGLILNAINPQIGGILIKGNKGTAKSTAVRALADLLPKIKIVKDCNYNCNPDDLKESCHECQHLIEERKLKPEKIEFRNMRVINLPINATEDRVIGTIDIEKALKQGLKALEPGILADAHRNILYIDEVNLLSDNVADVLLDAAAMGINIIEREGISLHHPSNFILVGTMNPEEGNLRPQLLDRFGLSIEVERILDVDKRVQIIKNSEEYHNDPQSFHDKFEPFQEELRQKIINAREILPLVSISDDILKKIAKICIIYATDGHRADITINLAAKTLAAFHGSEEVSIQDLKTAAKLALPHRLRRLPFEDDTFDNEKLDQILKEEKISDEKKQSDIPDENESKSNENELESNKNDGDERTKDNIQQQSSNLNNNSHNKDEKRPKMNNSSHNTQVFQINNNINIKEIIKPKIIKKTLNSSGNIVSHPTFSKNGKYVKPTQKRKINIPHDNDIAVMSTINTAASDINTNNISIAKNSWEKSIEIKEKHIRYKKREGKSSYLVIFCVDGSGSMGVKNRMETVKGAIFSILQHNYIHRDKVSLVVFRDNMADIILAPTRSTDLAYNALKEIPTGGNTPLAAGLVKALEIAHTEIQKKTGYIPLIILLSDGKGNVYYKDPLEDIEKISKEIAKKEIDILVINTELSKLDLGFNDIFFKQANAKIFDLDSLNLQNLNHILKNHGILEEI